MENSLEKGKSMPVGTITNGFKKIAEGKWRKVSEAHGLTKEEHEYQAKYSKEEATRPTIHSAKHESNSKWHSDEASKLDSKEYSDVDVVGKEKEEYKKGDKIKVQESGDWHEGIYMGEDGENHHKVQIKSSIGVHRSRTVHSSAIKKSTTDDIEKALVTLEIGYLAGQVSEEQIQKARKSIKNG
jgi:hypothetical protein